MKRSGKLLVAVAALALVSGMRAQEAWLVRSPSQLDWQTAPPSLASDAQGVVADGDPRKAGPFTVPIGEGDRVRSPADDPRVRWQPPAAGSAEDF